MRQFHKTAIFAAMLSAAFVVNAQDATAPSAETPPAAAVAAPAAAASLPAGISAPPEGKGQIVFFRESRFVGGGVGFKVREGEIELGKLSNGTYFVHVADPGAHSYTVHSEAKDVLNMEIEAGETYYVSGGISMGVLVGRPNISPSDQASFEKLAGKIKPAKPLKKK